MSDQDIITRQDIADALWTKGQMSAIPGQLRKSQEILYAEWSKCKSNSFVACCGRGWGKSHLLFLLCVETALRYPQSDSVFVAPVQKKVKEFLEPIARHVLENSPVWLRPEFHEAELIFRFPNGSRIIVCGSNNQQFDGIRGGTYKFAAIDEAAYHDYLVELVEQVLKPALMKGKGKLFMASTPRPISHPFDSYMTDAELNRALFHATIYEAGYSEEEITTAKRDAGWSELEQKWKSEAHELVWRVEYLAERGLHNTSRLVVPEWDESTFKQSTPRPTTYQFYRHYIGLDSGFRDFTAITFATLFWKEGILQFEGELQFLEKEVRSDLIIPKVIAKAKALWGDNWKPYYCIADSADPIFINELNKYELTFYGVEKKSLRAMVNDFRVQVGASKVMASTECPYLLSNLRSAIWTDDGAQIDKDAFNHHFDHLMAAIYLSRYVNWNFNPIPNTFQVPTLHGTDVIPPWVKERLKNDDPNVKAFSRTIKQQQKIKPPRNASPIRL